MGTKKSIQQSLKTTPAKKPAKRRGAAIQDAPDADAKLAGQDAKSPAIAPEERYKMIAHLAYLRAE